MPVYITKEKREELFKEYGGSEKNTGSIEGQIAVLTFRIKALSDHLRINHKDFSCKRALLTMVGRRKRLLQYLGKKDISKYRGLIEKLGLRK